jgi:putative ABC transport system ATP-binding protein
MQRSHRRPVDRETAVIELSDVEFAWDDQRPVLALEHLAVERGERIFVQGPSGSGKSTLLGLLAGVLVPKRGSVRVLGSELTRLANAARDRFRGDHIGFVFQMFNLVPYLSVLENVTLPLHFSAHRARRIGKNSVRAEVTRLLEDLGLNASTLVGRPVSELSIGQQQRVAAARALLGNPEIILADEPTSALDADNRERFLSLLSRECASRRATLVFVSHDASLAPLFDRAISLSNLNQCT